MFHYSKHCIEQMKQRGISMIITDQVLAKPDNVSNEDGLEVYQSEINEDGKKHLVRVFVNSLKNPPLVVTVYKTSKIKKYKP